jgi:serine/threonine protein kinase
MDQEDDKTRNHFVLSKGTMVSHYRIIEQIGSSGRGVVYKAQDTKLDRIVALKFLPKHLLGDEEAKTRLVDEVETVSALDHPNIATIYEIDEAKGEWLISRAYLEGKSLKEIVKGKAIPVRTALEIAIKVGEGLTAAHKRRIVHGNVKSSNVMLTKEGGIKITDFGLPTWKPGSGFATTGETLGEIQYLSPEQARGEKVDHRTDIFSFGLVLYEMITGQLPFTGDDETAIINSILNDDAQALATYQKEVSEQLQRVLDKLLQKDIKLRYQTMDEALADLHGLKRELISKRRLVFRKIRPRYKTILIPALIICFIIAVILLVLLNKYLLSPILRKEGSVPHPSPIGAMCLGEGRTKYFFGNRSQMFVVNSDRSGELRGSFQNPPSWADIIVKA